MRETPSRMCLKKFTTAVRLRAPSFHRRSRSGNLSHTPLPAPHPPPKPTSKAGPRSPRPEKTDHGGGGASKALRARSKRRPRQQQEQAEAPPRRGHGRGGRGDDGEGGGTGRRRRKGGNEGIQVGVGLGRFWWRRRERRLDNETARGAEQAAAGAERAGAEAVSRTFDCCSTQLDQKTVLSRSGQRLGGWARRSLGLVGSIPLCPGWCLLGQDSSVDGWFLEYPPDQACRVLLGMPRVWFFRCRVNTPPSIIFSEQGPAQVPPTHLPTHH